MADDIVFKVACSDDVMKVKDVLPMSCTDQSEDKDSHDHLDIRDSDYQTDLHLAMDRKNTVVHCGSDINVLSERVDKGLLGVEIHAGAGGAAGDGADVNVQNLNVETAFMLLVKDVATCNRSDINCLTITECVQILIDIGADVSMISREGRTVLMYAAESDHLVHLLSMLVKAGAVIDQQDNSGMTALTHAVSTGSHECVRWLVDHGASVDICDYLGNFPIHHLMSSNNNDQNAEQCLEILLEKQANVNATDHFGITPLMHVARNPVRATRTMAMLLSNGAEINLVDKRGQTALIHSLAVRSPQWYLSENCNRELEVPHDRILNILFLLDKGANFSVGTLAEGKLSTVAALPHDLDLLNLQVGDEVDMKVSWDDFISIICANRRRILLFMIINGVVPSQQTSRKRVRNLAFKSIFSGSSLLEIAMKAGHLGVTKYLISTCYLCRADLKFSSVKSSMNSAVSHNLEVVTAMQDLRSQPWPLVKLCFVAVSTQFGASPGRQERVKNSQLPPKLQKMLLFQEPWSRLCVHQWDKIPLTFNWEKYEKLPRPRPLLFHWPVGRALVPCDCGECDGCMYKYECIEDN